MARRKHLDFAGVAEPVRIGATARAILHKTVDDGVSDLDTAKEIRLDLIEPDPDQPRKSFEPDALLDLAQSIRLQGVLQPIVVEWVPERERFRIISGERRWRATHLAGEQQNEDPEAQPRRDLGRIPAIIRNPSAIDRYLQQIYENEQRQDYSDVERAFAYERLKESLALTWDELAGKLGLSKGRIHQIRRTKNRLAASVQRDITNGVLTGRHGLYLAPLPERVQEIAAQAVKDYHLTHQQTRTLVDRLKTAIQDSPKAAAHFGVVGPAAGVEGEAAPQPVGVPTATAGEPAGEGARETIHATAATNDLTEHGAISPSSPPVGEGVASYTPAVQEVVAQTVVEVTAPKPDIPRARTHDLDKALAQVRQLLRLDLKLPATAAERDKLAAALGELIAWAEALRARLGT